MIRFVVAGAGMDLLPTVSRGRTRSLVSLRYLLLPALINRDFGTRCRRQCVTPDCRSSAMSLTDEVRRQRIHFSRCNLVLVD